MSRYSFLIRDGVARELVLGWDAELSTYFAQLWRTLGRPHTVLWLGSTWRAITGAEDLVRLGRMVGADLPSSLSETLSSDRFAEGRADIPRIYAHSPTVLGQIYRQLVLQGREPGAFLDDDQVLEGELFEAAVSVRNSRLTRLSPSDVSEVLRTGKINVPLF